MTKISLNNVNLFLKTFEGKHIGNVFFQRTFGLVNGFDNFLNLSFCDSDDNLICHCMCDFRVIYKSRVISTYNDLYVCRNRKKELSVRKYRKQESIESSLLFDTLNEVSEKIGQQQVLGVVCKPYGDLYFDFGNETMIEFINDSQLEDFELYRLFKEHGEQYIAKIKGGEVEFYRS